MTGPVLSQGINLVGLTALFNIFFLFSIDMIYDLRINDKPKNEKNNNNALIRLRLYELQPQHHFWVNNG